MGKRIHPSCHTVDTRRARFNGKGGVTRVALVTVHSGAKRPCPIRLIRLSSSWRAAVFRRGQINKRIEQQPFHQKKNTKLIKRKRSSDFALRWWRPPPKETWGALMKDSRGCAACALIYTHGCFLLVGQAQREPAEASIQSGRRPLRV